MIINYFILALYGIDANDVRFQQDVATLHISHATIDLLPQAFDACLISRSGDINWLTRSCQLTPLNYFFVGRP